MYELTLQWKEFNISLDNLENYMKTNFDSYIGNQASKYLTLYFSDPLSQEDKDSILDHYQSLDGSDYKSKDQIKLEQDELQQAIALLKQDMVSKSWDQMSTVERKVMMDLEVSREELGL